MELLILIAKYALGILIGSSISLFIFMPTWRKYYYEVLSNIISILLAILFILPALVGFVVSLIKHGYKIGVDLYSRFIMNL